MEVDRPFSYSLGMRLGTSELLSSAIPTQAIAEADTSNREPKAWLEVSTVLTRSAALFSGRKLASMPEHTSFFLGGPPPPPPPPTLQLHLPFVYKHCSFLLPFSHLSNTHLDDIANVGTGSTSTFYSHVIRHIDGR